jgi:rare lipoprotein A (peptidoglycan hydrolase)
VTLSGALLSVTSLAATLPAIASSDPQATAAPAAATAKAKTSSTLSVRKVRRHVIAGRKILVAGRLRPAGAGHAVALQISRGRGWTTVDHDRTDAHGGYRLTWRTTRTGTTRLRVTFGGTAQLASARRAAGHANVYRRALASWYGPGLYGQHLACGGRLTTGTLGVANKSLPCGTKVTLRYHGHTVRVPVVDRGPYVGAREFDLTAATKQRLHFGSTGTVMTTR